MVKFTKYHNTKIVKFTEQKKKKADFSASLLVNSCKFFSLFFGKKSYKCVCLSARKFINFSDSCFFCTVFIIVTKFTTKVYKISKTIATKTQARQNIICCRCYSVFHM